MVLESLLAVAASGVAVLLFAAYLAWSVLRLPTGTKKMGEIASAIQEGATAYLSRQYKTLVPIVVILFALIWWLAGIATASAFLGGVFLSALAGYIGMMVSVRA